MREALKDYYTLLGVQKRASDKEIKLAFRRKAKEYHPDTSRRTDADEMFKLLNKAYSVLRDRKKREAYNHQLMGEIFEKEVVSPAQERFSRFGYTSEVSEDDWGWRVG
ncbi:MAG: DnaJ domain-containing protein [Candidatus Sedimenticola sp. (ex Thyasira tokunagai)]